MGRRRRHRVEITLFPFLSVLVSVIGALTLIIIGSALGTSGERMEALADVAPARVRRAELEARREAMALVVERRTREAEDLAARQHRIHTARATVKALTDKVRAAEKDGEAADTKLSKVNQALAESRRRFEALQARRGGADKPARIHVPKPVVDKTEFRPLFVDCRKDGITILQTGRQIPTASIAADGELGRILRLLMAAKEKWCIYLLVRADGMDAFEKIFKRVRDRRVRFGMYPVLTDKDFDVKDWQKPDWLER